MANENPRAPRSKLALVKALGLSAERQVRSASNDVIDSLTDLRGCIDVRPDPFRQCRDGERTAHLLSLLGMWYGQGKPHDEVLLLARGWNSANYEPLPDEKVTDMCASMLRTHERNHARIANGPKEFEPLFDLEEARVERFVNYDPPPRRWLLVDCLPLGKVGLLVAPGGTGKSQLALQIAISVATGVAVADWWQVGEKGRVLALFAEEDEEELHRRVRTILRGVARTPEQEADLRGNLFIRSMTAADNLMTKADSVGSVTRTSYAERLCATVKELSDLKLIIIDPASRFRGGNENTAEDATRFVEALELIAKTTGATVLVLHHANKASTKDGEQNQTASRGSSALTDGVRFQMNLALVTDKQATDLGLEEGTKHEYIAAKITKSNYAPAGGMVFLRRGEQGVLTYHEPSKAHRATQAVRLSLLVQVVREEAANKKFYSKSSFADRYGDPKGLFTMGKNKLGGLIDGALAAGVLVQEPGSGRHLRATEKSAAVAEAKVPSAGHVHEGT
jgi:RecA-family ATPase